MLGFNWPELLVIALVGFFVFGPERLPAKAREAAQMVRRLRDLAQNATDDLRAHMPDGDDLGLADLRELRDLHPRRIMSRAFFDDEAAPQGSDGPGPGAVGRPVTADGSAAGPAGWVAPYDLDAT